MEDLQIMDLYLARDEQAIQETANKYGPLCYKIARNVLYSAEDSEECVNDTYWNTWNEIPPQKPNNFMAFLCKITRNLSLKRLDYNLAQKRSPNLCASLEDLENIASDDEISGEIEAKELGEVISRFLQTQPVEHRKVFLRKYWFFDSIETIAEQYGFSEGQVKSMLYRTRKRLKEYLRKEGIV